MPAAVRDMLSSPMWEEFNKFYLLVRSADRAQVLDAPLDFFHQIILTGYTLDGATQSTMSHTEAWHFHRLGELLEPRTKLPAFSM